MTAAEVRAARRRLGLTQVQMSIMLRYRRGASTIADIETGRRGIGKEPLALLHRYLKGYRPADWPGI